MATAVPGGSADPSPAELALDRSEIRRGVLALVVRTAIVTGVMAAVYATIPTHQRLVGAVGVRLLLGLLVLFLVLAWQIRAVLRSPHPMLRGVEAIAVSVPLLVFMFAGAYFVTADASPGVFTEDLSRLDAVYFAMTVLSTVGFGDISPVSDAARVLVMMQMVVNLIFGGLILKVLVGAVRRRRQDLQSDTGTFRLQAAVDSLPAVDTARADHDDQSEAGHQER